MTTDRRTPVTSSPRDQSDNSVSNKKVCLLSVAAVPVQWKQAIITPVFKKGTTGDVSNYRPISLTCVACKIMERVIAQRIYSHLTSNNLLSHAQHGFVKQRSTCTNLLEFVNDWTILVQNKKAVTIAYIDFFTCF